MPEEAPAGIFTYPDSSPQSGTFPYTDLPQFTTIEPPATFEKRKRLAPDHYYHPDSNAFTLELSETTAIAHLPPLKLNRSLEATLHVRTADSRNSYDTATSTLDPTEDGGDTGFHDHTIEFDISHITQPYNKAGHAILTTTDPITGITRTLTRHQYVAFNTPDGTHCTPPTAPLNIRYYRDERNAPMREVPTNPDVGYYEYEDFEDHRRIYLATRANSNGELIAGTTAISHDMMETYRRETFRHGFNYGRGLTYECHFADHISHLNELGRTIKESQDYAGLTSDFDRLESLGDLIQHMTYVRNFWENNVNDSPSAALYNLVGNCSERTGLFIAINRSKHWQEYRTAGIRVDLRGEPHFVVGIDERDFTHPNPERAYYVPADKPYLPDTRYAFLELTSDNTIGQFNEDVYEMYGVADTGSWENVGSYSDEPPDY